MPKLTLEMFDSPPEVGQKVNIKGEILSIDEDGTVEVSYDEISSQSESEKETESDGEGSEDMMDAESDVEKSFRKFTKDKTGE